MKRFSPQRQAVYDAVASTTSHPTAEWVYQSVRKEIPRISLGTVYRNLADLKSDGRLIGFSDESGIEHFDAITETHIHFKCTVCGEVSDVLGVNNEEADRQVEALTGADISTSVYLYFGKCKKCKNQIIKTEE